MEEWRYLSKNGACGILSQARDFLQNEVLNLAQTWGGLGRAQGSKLPGLWIVSVTNPAAKIKFASFAGGIYDAFLGESRRGDGS